VGEEDEGETVVEDAVEIEVIVEAAVASRRDTNEDL